MLLVSFDVPCNLPRESFMFPHHVNGLEYPLNLRSLVVQLNIEK